MWEVAVDPGFRGFEVWVSDPDLVFDLVFGKAECTTATAPLAEKKALYSVTC